MSTDRDDAPVRRYREASATLDERPSAAARAAILAAAARQVEAGPQAAGAPRVARRSRWPLAAAAAVLLSTLAVMMATRTEQEMPTFTAPAERASAPVAVAPAPPIAPADSAAPATAPPAAQPPSVVAKRSAPPVARDEHPLPGPAARVGAQRADAAEAGASTSAAEQAPGIASVEPRQAFPAAPQAAAPAAAPLARSTPAPAVAGAMRAPAADVTSRQEASSADRAVAREAVPAPSGARGAQGAARLDATRAFEGSAPAWVEHIVRLRREGRDADADAELKRFRERYPDVPVPPAALPGGGVTGTR